MLIARRASGRGTTDFPVGSHIIARPATVSTPIAGVVVAISGPYTLTVSAHGVEIAVDVEDCISPNRLADTWRRRSIQVGPARRVSGTAESSAGAHPTCLPLR